MNNFMYWFLVPMLFSVQAKFREAKIDPDQLKCLVCKATINEFNHAIAKIDPTEKVDVGSYRIDGKGNLQQRKVPKAKSEVHLSELSNTICDTMDNYIRGTWKDDGTLTIFKLIDSDGKMNSQFSLIDIIQDDDLNKSLKYYCENILEEYEEHIIAEQVSDFAITAEKFCIDHANYCMLADFIEKEHLEVPGSENDFLSQFGANPNFNADFDAEGEAEDIESEDALNELPDVAQEVSDTDGLHDATEEKISEVREEL